MTYVVFALVYGMVMFGVGRLHERDRHDPDVCHRMVSEQRTALRALARMHRAGVR